MLTLWLIPFAPLNAPFLLFDLGGVLIANRTFTRLKELLPGTDEASLKARWLACDAVRRFELGQIDAAEFARTFLAQWSIDLTVDDFLQEFVAWPSGFFPGAGPLLASLHSSYRLGCLSNCNSMHWARLAPLLEAFDLRLSSHLIGLIKPDPEVFVYAAQCCRVEPQAICFFDDSIANVEAASVLGLRAFHTDGFDALLATLHSLGVLARFPAVSGS